MKKNSVRRTATLEVATDSEEENYLGGLKKSGSKRKSSLNKSDSSTISGIPRKLTKADQTILTDSTGKPLPPRKSTSIYSKYSITPPRKSTSIYSKYSIAKAASNASLQSKKSNASITKNASLKGAKAKAGKATKKKAPVKVISPSHIAGAVSLVVAHWAALQFALASIPASYYGSQLFW